MIDFAEYHKTDFRGTSSAGCKPDVRPVRNKGLKPLRKITVLDILAFQRTRPIKKLGIGKGRVGATPLMLDAVRREPGFPPLCA